MVVLTIGGGVGYRTLKRTGGLLYIPLCKTAVVLVECNIGGVGVRKSW